MDSARLPHHSDFREGAHQPLQEHHSEFAAGNSVDGTLHEVCDVPDEEVLGEVLRRVVVVVVVVVVVAAAAAAYGGDGGGNPPEEVLECDGGGGDENPEEDLADST